MPQWQGAPANSGNKCEDKKYIYICHALHLGVQQYQYDFFPTHSLCMILASFSLRAKPRTCLFSRATLLLSKPTRLIECRVFQCSASKIKHNKHSSCGRDPVQMPRLLPGNYVNTQNCTLTSLESVPICDTYIHRRGMSQPFHP